MAASIIVRKRDDAICTISISADKGSHWAAANTGLANPPVSALAMNNGVTFAGSNGDVLSSRDDGATWTAHQTLGMASISALASIGTSLFGTTGWGGQVVRSTDAGATWVQVFTEDIYLVTSLAVVGSDLFVGTLQGVYRSTDNGTSWMAAGNGLPGTTSLRDNVQALIAEGSTLYAGTGGRGVYRSTNLGADWYEVNSGLANLTVHAFAIIGPNIFVGTNAGVFLTTNDGAGWTAVNSGLTDTTITCFATRGTNLFSGSTNQGVFVSTNQGATWRAVSDGLMSPSVASLVASGKNLILGSTGSGIWLRPLAEMIPLSVTDFPNSFSKVSNFPNPFTTSTDISFAIANRNDVQIEVFDMLGRSVSVLANAEMDAGLHSVKFDAGDLASGVYTVVMTAGGKRSEMRMILGN